MALSELEQIVDATKHESLWLQREWSTGKEETGKIAKEMRMVSTIDPGYERDGGFMSLELNGIGEYLKHVCDRHKYNTFNLFIRRNVHHDEFLEKFPDGVRQYQVKLVGMSVGATDLNPELEDKNEYGFVHNSIYIAAHTANRLFDNYCGSSAILKEWKKSSFQSQVCTWFLEDYETMVQLERELIYNLKQAIHPNISGEIPEFGKTHLDLRDGRLQQYYHLLNIANGGQGRRPIKETLKGSFYYCLNRLTKEIRFYEQVPNFGHSAQSDWEISSINPDRKDDMEQIYALQKSCSMGALYINRRFADALMAIY